MTNATDKQIYFLKSKGIDATSLSKEAASQIISDLKEKQAIPVEKPGQTTVYQPYQSKVYDKTSYYVAYAKDLAVAMINSAPHQYVIDVGLDAIMDFAIDCIKKARSELNHN